MSEPWRPGDPCPGCGQRPCVCVTISLPRENQPGWWDENDYWHNGYARTHTETTTDAGPNYCHECSEAHGDWVRWPCGKVDSDE